MMTMLTLGPADFPNAEDRSAFESIKSRLTAFEAVCDEGDIAASAQFLSPESAEQLASDIRALQAKYPLATTSP